MRTRAMACLRRPVAAPGPEAAGLRASTTGVSDSLVYSVSSCSSPWTTSVSTAEVVSATVLLVSSVYSDDSACTHLDSALSGRGTTARPVRSRSCLLYTSDAADEEDS